MKKILAITAFSLMILGLPAIASAQWGGYGGYGRNDDNYGNGRYNRNLRATVENLKNRAKNFERRVDRVNDRRDDRDDRWEDRDDRWNNRNDRYDRLEDLARDFRNATKDLKDAYGRGRNMGNSSDEARRVLDLGSRIDRVIYNTRAGYQLENDWNAIRHDLNVLADAYGYNYNNNRNRNRNSNRNRGQYGDWRSRIPFPLPF